MKMVHTRLRARTKSRTKTDTWQQASTRASFFKLIGGFLFSLIVLGFATSSYLSNFPTKAEVKRLVDDHVNGPGHQVSIIRIEDHEKRLIRLESDSVWIKSTLYNIADKLGAATTLPPP